MNVQATEEQIAIDRLRQRDLSGLETLVNQYYDQAVRSAYLILRDHAQAEDVVQTAFVELPAKIHQYDPNRPFRAWFLRWVVNASVNLLKRDSRSIPLEQEEQDSQAALNELVSQQISPEDFSQASELRRAVWQALEQLTPSQRAAIVLRYYLDFSEAEMAAHLSSPPSSIKWWLHSARLRLRKLLASFHSGEGLAPAEQPDKQ